MEQDHPAGRYFIAESVGAKPRFQGSETQQLIIELRKKSLSVPDIKAILDALNHSISQRSITNILERAGFARLPRRSKKERQTNPGALQISAPTTQMLSYESESFTSNAMCNLKISLH